MLTGGHVRWNHLHSTGDRPWYLCGRGHFAGDLSRLHCIRYHDPLTRHPYPRFRSGICSNIILALLGFFHADPLLLHLDFCRLICYNVEDLVVFLPKLMNHWMQTYYIHTIYGSLPLLAILTFYIGYFWQVDLRPSSTQTPYRQSSWSPVLLFSWY